MSFSEGEVIAQRYQVINLIGTGTGGEVYKVWDRKRSTYLALKLLKPEWNNNPKIIASFLDEAKALADLQHPNIVRFYELVQIEGTSFFLMDYVDGITLRKVLEESLSALNLDQILPIMAPVCRALNYAHQHKVIHCDVKPENILIDRNGVVYLTDFGIAFNKSSENNFLAKSGTPTYMAPEQIVGVGVSPQTDIYALGVVLYEMSTLETPFQGNSASDAMSIIDRICWEQVNKDPLPPIEINPSIGRDTNKIILKCLNKEPQQRYSGSIELLEALERLRIKQSASTDQVNGLGRESSNPVSPHRKIWIPVGLAIVAVVIIVSLIFKPGSLDKRLPASEVFQQTSFDYENGCMQIDFPSQANSILEECVTRVSIDDKGNLTLYFRWELTSSSQNFGINIESDTNNPNMYILDDLGNRWDHISTGGGANQNKTLTNGQSKDGWFLFPPLPPEAKGFYFVDDDNQVRTELLERKW